MLTQSVLMEMMRRVRNTERKLPRNLEELRRGNGVYPTSQIMLGEEKSSH